MNNATLRDACNRIKAERKTLHLESGTRIGFDSCDFSDGGMNSDHINLYRMDELYAVIDLRSVSGVSRFDG